MSRATGEASDREYDESITTGEGHRLAMADIVVVPKRVGGSLSVIIPAEVVRQEGLEEGKPVLLSVRPMRPRAEAFGKLRGRVPKYRDRADEGGYD